MGFVVESRDWSDGDEEGQPSFSAFVFESNTEGEKVGASKTNFFFSACQCCTDGCGRSPFHLFIHRYVTP